MVTGAFLSLVAWLYYLCFLLRGALTVFIVMQGATLKGSRRTHLHAQQRVQLRRSFCWLACSLLLWQLTLFLEVRTPLPAAQLWLGRLNFTAIVFAPYLALRFVQEIPCKASCPRWIVWCRAETILLALLTLLTPLVSAAERVEDGQAITTYGPLFPFCLVHVLGYLVATLLFVFRERYRAHQQRVRSQLTLIGMGALTTGGIAFITNAVLPYGWEDFRFCDVGALSTLCFLLTVAYATFIHRLFDLRVVVRETLVYGVLLAFVLGAYSSAIFVISQYLTDSAGELTQFAVLVIAFSLDPLRRFLEEKTDRLLFGPFGGAGAEKGAERKRSKHRRGQRMTLALLFPWRRQ